MVKKPLTPLQRVTNRNFRLNRMAKSLGLLTRDILLSDMLAAFEGNHEEHPSLASLFRDYARTSKNKGI